MKYHQEKKFIDSWFFKWFLNNQAVVAVLTIFPVFLILYLFTKIPFLFTPIISFIAIIMLPLVISVILYYLTKPLVDFIEKRGVSRTTSIFIMFAIIITLLTWVVASFIPAIQEQLASFIKNLPSYVRSIDAEANKFLESPWLANYQEELEEMLSNVSTRAIGHAENFSKNAVDWASNFASAAARVTVAIVMSPFILFYFLRDSGKMKEGLLKTLPVRMRRPISHVLGDISRQLVGYVQGQVTVAIVVGIMFTIFLNIIGLRYAATFGIITGFLNMIPYLGGFLAMVPVVTMGVVQGPVMLIKVLITFVIEQITEGRFASPLVLGSKLNIHPITIMSILLTSEPMFGAWGVFLGIPIYASTKVVVKEILEWHKRISGSHEEEVLVIEGEEKAKNVE